MLRQYLQVAKFRWGYKSEEYEEALQYLFSGMLIDNKKANELAIFFKDKTPKEILEYFPTGGAPITNTIVDGVYNMTVNQSFLMETLKPADTYKTLDEFLELENNLAGVYIDNTVDADDFKAFGLYNMAKDVNFGDRQESDFFYNNKGMVKGVFGDSTRVLSTPEALFGIARNEIDTPGGKNDGYANAKLYKIGYKNLEAYMNIAKEVYLDNHRNHLRRVDN